MEIVDKYSHLSVQPKDSSYPMFILATFKNKGLHADKGPGKPSPYKYSSFMYGEIPGEGPKFWMTYMSETRLKNIRKRGVENVSQDAYQFIIKIAFEKQKQIGDSKYNLKEMVRRYG